MNIKSSSQKDSPYLEVFLTENKVPDNQLHKRGKDVWTERTIGGRTFRLVFYNTTVDQTEKILNKKISTIETQTKNVLKKIESKVIIKLEFENIEDPIQAMRVHQVVNLHSPLIMPKKTPHEYFPGQEALIRKIENTTLPSERNLIRFELGQKLMRYDEAEGLYWLALATQSPGASVGALLHLAHYYEGEKKYQTSGILFRKVIALFPELVERYQKVLKERIETHKGDRKIRYQVAVELSRYQDTQREGLLMLSEIALEKKGSPLRTEARKFLGAIAKKDSTEAKFRYGKVLRRRSSPKMQRRGNWYLSQAAKKGHEEAKQLLRERGKVRGG